MAETCRRCGSPQEVTSVEIWTDWRGQIVKFKGERHTTRYVVVAGSAGDAIRGLLYPEYRNKHLVLVPITRDTDEDSFAVADICDVEVVE